MEPLEIAENVYWVGVIDWDERDFHGFDIIRGATYNAYLIVDEKITLVDTVKHKFFNEMIERVRKVVEPEKIDYIIANHIEPDHSGSLANMKRIAKDAIIVSTHRGKDGIEKLFNKEKWDFKVVKTGRA